MQMTHMNQPRHSFALVHSQSKVHKKNTVHKLYPVIAYLSSLPFVGLLVRAIRLTWRIIAFIISCFAGKTISEQRKLERTQVLAIEPETRSSVGETEQEKQLKEHFLVMASHELKTPLTTILGQAQLLLRRLSKMPELSSELVAMRSALERIDGQVHRLNALVDDVLDLYNVRAGKTPLHLSSCNLVDMCREVVEEQRFLTSRTIELEVPPTPVMLQADNDRLSQVVVNLVNNAIRYSPEDSPVKVLVEWPRDTGIIEVHDFGIGIPQDQRTHIFEPFYRGPHMQSSSKSGLGLGLTICKDIVERHHGRIWCRSRVGKGSIFIVELPLNKNVA